MSKRAWIATCFALQVVIPPSAGAESPDHSVSFSWAVTVASKYLFQGVDYSDGKAVVQPELSLAYREFSLTSWSNFNLDERHFDEFDWLFGYTREFGPLTITPGYAYYHYPNRGWDASHEIYLDMSVTTVLDLSLSSHYDFDEGEGSYFTLSASRGVAIFGGDLAVGSNVFYQRNYYEVTGIPSIEFNVAYSLPVHRFIVTPSVSYFATWENGDFRDDAAVPSAWLVSLTISPSD